MGPVASTKARGEFSLSLSLIKAERIPLTWAPRTHEEAPQCSPSAYEWCLSSVEVAGWPVLEEPHDCFSDQRCNRNIP
jgi:hypothetical protein